MKAGHALTKGLIYGIMFLALFAFVGVALEAVIIAVLPLWTMAPGVVPLILGVFGLAGSVAIAFSEYLEIELGKKAA